MRRKYQSSSREQRDEQFHLAFSDLFAGMVGVVMLLAFYFFNAFPFSGIIVQSDFDEVMEKRLNKVENTDQSVSEAVHCYEDHMVVSGLNNEKISIENILYHEPLKEYLRDLYLNKDGRALLVMHERSYDVDRVFTNLLSSLAYEDKRFGYYSYLLIHKNFDFIRDEELKKQYEAMINEE